MSEKVRVLLADDHALFRRGLIELLREQSEFALLDAVSDGAEAVESVRKHRPDVILMDVHMPAGGGVKAVQIIKQEMDVKVIMLTVSPKDEDLLAAIEAGADGYLLKNVEPEELYRAVRDVVSGKAVLSPEVTGKVMALVADDSTQAAGPALTPREREVLQLLAQGGTSAEIAVSLNIAISTVKTHVRHILKKFEAGNRAEAVAKAGRLGMLKSA